MDEQQQRSGPQGQPSTQQGAQMQQGQQQGQQQGGPSAQQGSAQQSQFSANAGQQGGEPGGSASGAQPGGGTESPQAARGSNRYTDFLSGRGGSPFELLKRLDEDVDRLFHQFIGGGRELLRGRMRDRTGADTSPGMPAGAGSSGGVDETMAEAAGGGASSSTAMGTSPASGWLPQVEVSERGGRLHVSLDLPGMQREDLQLHFDHGQLVVQGERRTTSTTTQPGGYYRSERSYGHFRRSIPLPEGVNPDTAQASFHNGVLDVSFDMPVRHNRSRQIPIQDGGAGAGGSGGGMSGGTTGSSGSAAGGMSGSSGAGSEAGS